MTNFPMRASHTQESANVTRVPQVKMTSMLTPFKLIGGSSSPAMGNDLKAAECFCES